MRPEKPGLADLKRLRSRQQSATESPTPSIRKTASKKKPASGGLAAQATSSSGSAAEDPIPAEAAAHGMQRPSSHAALDDADRTLFRRAVKTVKPIKAAPRASPPPRPKAPADLLRQRRELAMGGETARLSPVSDHYAPAGFKHDDSSFLQSGHGPDLIKGLKRGKWPIEASLDLHGSTLDEARERLEQFLQSCLAHRIKCVRIVHGKGYGSKDGASVLKQTVRRWLTQVQDVKAYAECREQDGGAGAIQALLRTEAKEPRREI